MVAWLNARHAHSLPFMRKRITKVAPIAGLAVIYILAARLGLVFDPVSGFATLVWPPTGISLAALLIFGQRLWPGVFIGAFVANLLTGAPVGVALGIGVGNTAEALIGSLLVRRTPNFSFTLERVSSVVALIVFAVFFSTLISASVGVASLSLGHVVSPPHVQETWRAWWIGDMVGAILVAPVILVWRQAPRAQLPGTWVEGLALASAAVLFGVLMFFSNLPGIPVLATPFYQANLLLAILIWAALRFGQRGATATVFFVSVMAVAGTALGYGPFAQPDLHQSLLMLQTFMAILAATFLLL